MPERPPDPEDPRRLLARIDREQERIRDENEWLRPDPDADAFARRTEKELRTDPAGGVPWNAVRVLLPANADPLAPQDPARRALFVQHLAEITERAGLDPARYLSEPPAADPPPSARETLSEGACTACRGSCCRSGGDHAYLTEETIARQKEAHPKRTLAEIQAIYLEHLPAETVLDSCVYHSKTGCGLSRDLRSSTCNRHLCGKLLNLRSTIPEHNPPPLLAVLFDDGTWARTALIDGTGVRILAENTPDGA